MADLELLRKKYSPSLRPVFVSQTDSVRSRANSFEPSECVTVHVRSKMSWETAGSVKRSRVVAVTWIPVDGVSRGLSIFVTIGIYIKLVVRWQSTENKMALRSDLSVNGRRGTRARVSQVVGGPRRGLEANDIIGNNRAIYEQPKRVFLDRSADASTQRRATFMLQQAARSDKRYVSFPAIQDWWSFRDPYPRA